MQSKETFKNGVNDKLLFLPIFLVRFEGLDIAASFKDCGI